MSNFSFLENLVYVLEDKSINRIMQATLNTLNNSVATLEKLTDGQQKCSKVSSEVKKRQRIQKMQKLKKKTTEIEDYIIDKILR